MITLTDDEQATALRAVTYAFDGVCRAMATGKDTDENRKAREKLKRLQVILGKHNDNGMWRCLCAAPWRHPTCLVCAGCGMAVPT